MTCRIDRVSTEQGLVLCISGRLTSEELDVVRTELSGRRVVAFALAEVEMVDREAVKFIAQAESGGVELKSCPAYSNYLTFAIRTEAIHMTTANDSIILFAYSQIVFDLKHKVLYFLSYDLSLRKIDAAGERGNRQN
jgi:hypothetical protein